MIIYVDKDFKCHLTNDGTMLEVETPFFDGKCQTFIEGYRYIPQGYSWTNERGITFTGEMISPHRNYNELRQAQEVYDMINVPNEILPTRIDVLEAQVAYVSMMSDLEV